MLCGGVSLGYVLIFGVLRDVHVERLHDEGLDLCKEEWNKELFGHEERLLLFLLLVRLWRDDQQQAPCSLFGCQLLRSYATHAWS